MMRLTLAELEQRCQKPDHRRMGSWMARRVARPGALRITWLVAPYGVSANAVTWLAWLVGIAAAAQFAIGSPIAWLCGAICLQLWYLLDHVDGQLARLQGTASLDGVQLDYVMHHTLNLLVPLGLGYGTSRANAHEAWLLAGLCWGLAALVNGLLHDTRYKAFVQRLKRVRGELIVRGGRSNPAPPAEMPRNPRRWIAWALQKSVEPPVTMNLISAVAVACCLGPPTSPMISAGFVTTMCLANGATAIARLWKSQQRQAAEQEFAAWFAPPKNATLEFRDGWWEVVPNARDIS